MASADNSRRPRARNLKRTFVFLRNDDDLRVPGKQKLKNLQDSGREKEIEFSNNATTENIAETLKNSFSAFLRNVDLARVYCYKTVGSTRVLSERGSCKDMCGDTLKLLFKYGGKVYLKVKQDNQGASSQVSQDNSNRGEQHISSDADDSDGNDAGDSHNEEESNSGDTSGEEDSSVGEEERTDARDADSNGDGDPGLSENESDNSLGQPVFQSTPTTSVAQSHSETSAFLGKLYDSVVISGPTVVRGASSGAMEVGTLQEVEDHLMVAELNERNGPAHDLQILRLYLEEHQVPQRLPFLCLNSQEMTMQSHQDCAPVVLVRFRATYQTVKIIRQLMMSDVVELLQKCNMHVSLMGSKFDQEVSGDRASISGQDVHVEFRILQPTMSSLKMVMGDIVSASDGEFIEQVAKAVEEAHQAAQAIKRQKELVLSDRQLRLQQEEDLRLSEIADKEKAANEKGDQEEEQDDREETVIDGEEVKKRRLAALEGYAQARKRQREDDETGGSDSEGDKSGTVTFKSS